jgi:hypothetical protein
MQSCGSPKDGIKGASGLFFVINFHIDYLHRHRSEMSGPERVRWIAVVSVVWLTIASFTMIAFHRIMGTALLPPP